MVESGRKVKGGTRLIQLGLRKRQRFEPAAYPITWEYTNKSNLFDLQNTEEKKTICNPLDELTTVTEQSVCRKTKEGGGVTGVRKGEERHQNTEKRVLWVFCVSLWKGKEKERKKER